ncbi:hypothetical protein E2C01_005568 [Portunus trituberculatus]|uniref:Uncharacterized protein n=1 Tax=Portunus trituberculatus TaxID=210409 RepID=A0A5B7CVV3_PORTR|nr:hypothetical protein [Portunus trituberculatus]
MKEAHSQEEKGRNEKSPHDYKNKVSRLPDAQEHCDVSKLLWFMWELPGAVELSQAPPPPRPWAGGGRGGAGRGRVCGLQECVHLPPAPPRLR